jgi:hypothetical protein
MAIAAARSALATRSLLFYLAACTAGTISLALEITASAILPLLTGRLLR